MELIEERKAVLTLSDRAPEQAPTMDLPALVTAYSPLLFRVAHAVLRNRSEAEDVVQDTFVRVLQHAASLHQIQNMRVWLVRIAWRLALDRRRRVQPAQLDSEFAAALAAHTAPADQALHEARRMETVLREIEWLPSAERRALLLSALDELPSSEIAEVLGRSEAAVRGLLFRARQRLRERLERKG